MESCLQLWPESQLKAMACLWVILLEGWMEAGGSLILPFSSPARIVWKRNQA